MVEWRERFDISRMGACDVCVFWELVQENLFFFNDTATTEIYTFLKAMPSARGRLLHYQQWNIDDQSVVSFAGMKFAAPAP